MLEVDPAALFHVSEKPDIAVFEPRLPASPKPDLNEPVVWAVDRAHLHNYLLPRDCPRVTFARAPNSTLDDVARLMPGTTTRRVVAIESAWLETVRRARLYLYELPAATFRLYDAPAGYYLSSEAVAPRRVTVVTDLLEALLSDDVELRVMPSLSLLRDLVVNSSLEFSIIRIRNAAGQSDRPAE